MPRKLTQFEDLVQELLPKLQPLADETERLGAVMQEYGVKQDVYLNEGFLRINHYIAGLTHCRTINMERALLYSTQGRQDGFAVMDQLLGAFGSHSSARTDEPALLDWFRRELIFTGKEALLLSFDIGFTRRGVSVPR